MPIFKHKHTNNFTVLPNALIEDKSLKLQDRGLLAFMLSRPDSWEFSIEGLAHSAGGAGLAALRASLDRIEAAGYLDRRQERNDNGAFGRNEWLISDKPDVRKPDIGKPFNGNRTQIRNENKKPSGRAHVEPRAGKGVDVIPDDGETEVLL